jgi:hypothetical protein
MLYNLEGVDELQQSFENVLAYPSNDDFWEIFLSVLQQVSEKNKQAIDYWAKSYVYQLQTFQNAFNTQMPIHYQVCELLQQIFRDAWMGTFTREHVWQFLMLKETYLFISKPL